MVTKVQLAKRVQRRNSRMSFSISSSTNVKGLSIRISDDVNGNSLSISNSSNVKRLSISVSRNDVNNITRPGVKYRKTAPSVERLLPPARSARILLTSPAKRWKPWSNWHRALSERQPRNGVKYRDTVQSVERLRSTAWAGGILQSSTATR